MQIKHAAWRPHGMGQLIVDEHVVLDGKFVEGDFEQGTVLLCNGSKWIGHLESGCMTGAGSIVEADCSKESRVFAHENVITCRLEDLHPGTQVALHSGVLLTIVKHEHDWVFRCRLHEEVHPRVRRVSAHTHTHTLPA
jgi:hypothetical protein